MHFLPAAFLLAATLLQPVLVDQTGHSFTMTSLRGKPVALTFVSAHCSDACPLINAQYSRAQSALKHAHSQLLLLTVTLDPERDSLSDMHRLARSFSANPRTWIVAGGTRQNVHALMDEFNVITRRGADGFADMHTTAVYLIDGKGTLRKTILPSADLTGELMSELHAGTFGSAR